MALTRIQPSSLDQTLNYTANTFSANYITFGDGTTQTTAGGGSAAGSYANSAFGQANAGFIQANAAFIQANTPSYVANSAGLYANGAFIQANSANTLAANSYIQANSAYNKANSANVLAQGAYDTANLKFNTSGGTITGNTIIDANLIVTGANVSLGNVGNVHIYGGNTGQVITTDNIGNLRFIDLPSTNTVSYTASTLTLTNGVYVSGSVTDTQVLNDGNAYQITDGIGTGPAWIITCTFTGVSFFNRVVSNINYTASSGHTIYFQIYNNTTSAWDNIGSYSGASGYTQYALEVLGYASYISSGTVQVRLYHSNAGNVVHTTLLDYFALEQSAQGSQGPRGATGATGVTGATGNGVSSGGTSGQILIKNSSTDYDTLWITNYAFDQANASFIQANSANTLAANSYIQANSGFIQANSANTLAANSYIQANAGFIQANSANTLAANSYIQANAGFIMANAAFAQANTGGGGGSSLGLIVATVLGWNLP